MNFPNNYYMLVKLGKQAIELRSLHSLQVFPIDNCLELVTITVKEDKFGRDTDIGTYSFRAYELFGNNESIVY